MSVSKSKSVVAAGAVGGVVARFAERPILFGVANARSNTHNAVDGLEQEIIERPGNAHEEVFLPGIDMLVELQDVAVVLEDEVGDGVHDAALVIAVDQQDRGIQRPAHPRIPYSAW